MNRPTRYIPNTRRIEIDITYACNLKCTGCDRSCTQAPEIKHLPLAAVEKLIQETESQNRVWESVHVLGGEPTLHPDFHKIIGVLDEWFQEHSPATELKVISNGYGKTVQEKLSLIPGHWHHDRSYKASPIQQHFEAFNQAPIDLKGWEHEDFSKGCWITEYCGVALTPQGYFPCAVAGGIERVMRFGHGLEFINDEALGDMLTGYCRYCGHFLQDGYRTRANREEVDTGTLSPIWQHAYRQWRVERKKKTE